MSKELLTDYTNLGKLPKFGDSGNKIELGLAKVLVISEDGLEEKHEINIDIKYVSDLLGPIRDATFIVGSCLMYGLRDKWVALRYDTRFECFRHALPESEKSYRSAGIINDIIDNDSVRGKLYFNSLTHTDLEEIRDNLLNSDDFDMYFKGKDSITIHELTNDQVIALFEHFRYSTLDKSGKDYLCYSEMTDKEKKIMSKDMYDSIIDKLKELIMNMNNTPGMPRTFDDKEVEGMKYKHLYKLIKEKLKTDDTEPQKLIDGLPECLGKSEHEDFIKGFLTGLSAFTGFIIVNALKIDKTKNTELFDEFMELVNYMREHGEDHVYLSTLHIYCGFDEDPVYLIEEVNEHGVQQRFVAFPKIDYTNTVYFTGNDPQGN